MPIWTMKKMIEIVRLKPTLLPMVSEFFQTIESGMFHPHGFSYDDAKKLCNYTGNDLFYVVKTDGEIFAYGLLRGWDDGFDVPCLGIYVGEKHRGKGIARMFMTFLHNAAKIHGANGVMLKVYKNNQKAISLYKSFGYILEEYDTAQFVGKLWM